MKEKIAGLAIFANLVLAAGKISVGWLSNSAAILAAGLDSFADIFASGISFLGIKLSAKPADRKHPYGHYKYEVLTGVIITIIIFLTGAGIIYDAYKNFLNPEIIAIGYLAIGVMLFSALVNEAMSRLKIHYGKRESSVSLLSDGVHSRIDAYSSLAILAGLFLTKYWIYADSILAFLIGLYIMKEAFSIGKDAMASLLDVAADPEIEERIKAIAKKQNIEIEDLKTQKKGSAVTANLQIKLPSNLSVEKASKLSDALKSKLIEEIEQLQYVAIQISSHELESSFYRPEFGRGFGWQRQKKAKDKTEGQGKGPEGECVCPQCGYAQKHERSLPCSRIKCPKCQIPLSRK